jgi:hypothetical protein
MGRSGPTCHTIINNFGKSESECFLNHAFFELDDRESIKSN